MGEERARMVCEWVRLAMEDLRYSRVGMEQGLEPKYAAFHAQQAVEKALKTLLISLGVKLFRKGRLVATGPDTMDPHTQPLVQL